MKCWFIIPSVIRKHLIVSLKEQMCIVVFKLLCYLLPQMIEAILVLLVNTLICYDPCIIMSTSIVVYIYDTVQSLIYYIVDNFMNSLHPFLIYISLIVHVWEPSYRHTDGTKSCFPHHFHQFWSCNRIPPYHFPVLPSNRIEPRVFLRVCKGIQCISKVPPHLHILHCLSSGFKLGVLRVNSKRHQQGAKDRKLFCFHLSIVLRIKKHTMPNPSLSRDISDGDGEEIGDIADGYSRRLWQG